MKLGLFILFVFAVVSVEGARSTNIKVTQKQRYETSNRGYNYDYSRYNSRFGYYDYRYPYKPYYRGYYFKPYYAPYYYDYYER